jgi:hypothetical protein
MDPKLFLTVKSFMTQPSFTVEVPGPTRVSLLKFQGPHEVHC